MDILQGVYNPPKYNLHTISHKLTAVVKRIHYFLPRNEIFVGK